MAYTTADLERIEQAIAGGTRTVSIDGRTVTYHSLAEMMRIRDAIRDELNGASPRRRSTFGVFVKR